jgi:NADH-quinone oxidoreductase subunit M
MQLELLFSPAVLRVLLLVVLFAPLGFAVLLALTGDRFRVARRLAGLLAVLHMAVTLYLTAAAAIYIADSVPGYSPSEFRPVAVPGDPSAGDDMPGGGQSHSTTWNLFVVGKADAKPPAAVQFFVGLDGLNVWLVALTSLMTYVAVVLSWRSATAKAGAYYAWVFVLQTAVTGAFVSFDVLLFYVFFELTLIPTFFLIGGWGVGGGRRDAARKFFLYTLLGSLFSLVGLIGIVYSNPAVEMPTKDRRLDPQTPLTRGPVSFSVNQLMFNVKERARLVELWATLMSDHADEKAKEVEEKRKQNAADLTPFVKAAAEAGDLAKAAAAERDGYKASQMWLFFALIAGFVVKVPLVPFHTWLPGAYSEAPAPITLLLSALLAKLGTLGMLRIVIPLCPDMAVQYGLPVFGTLGAIGIVYAAFCAFAQKDVKLMAAYSSVSHLGLLVLGLFALNAEGLSGATLHMVNHGLSAGAMFGLLAVLYDRYRTTDMTQLGGLWAKYPKYTFFVVVICLASVGLPGLNNFVTEMLLIGGLFKPWATGTTGYWLPVAASAGILLSAWYTFTMVKNVFFGPLKEPASLPDGVATGDLSGRELWALFLPAAACVALGVYPQPFLDVIKQDAQVIEKQVHQARLRVNPELANRESPPVQEPEEQTLRGETRR